MPNRDATSVANWLTGNRALRIVSRDRAGVYAEGITLNAPQAIQVADQWPLLTSLGNAIERALSRCQRHIREVTCSHAMGRSCAIIKVGWQYARLRALQHWSGIKSTPVDSPSGRNGHQQPASWIPIERILSSAVVKAAKASVL
ncbi:hypothetical protein [Mycetohabitans rhizoxinica]|nr:hypothetical protein [Mycetohabitans rhizoxinica]